MYVRKTYYAERRFIIGWVPERKKMKCKNIEL
jgi:hypothetical protein